MKRVVILGFIVVLLGQVTLTTSAQTVTPATSTPNIGDKIVVIAPLLDVYAHPSDNGPVVHELITGMVSRLLSRQIDISGDQWLYLTNGVQGWVRATTNNKPSLITRDDGQMQALIDNATGTLKQNPQSVDSYLTRAMAYMAQRNFKASGTDFDTAIQNWPNDARLYYYRSILDYAVYDYQQQQADSQKAIKLQDTLPYIYVQLGVSYEYLKNNTAAITAYTQASKLATDYGLIYHDLADAYKGEQQYDQALLNANYAVQYDPLFGLAYLMRGRLYQNQKQYDSAIQNFNQAINVDPYCSVCYIYRGIFLSEVKANTALALDDLNKSIALNPFDSLAYAERGVTYRIIGQYPQAIRDLEQSTHLNPANDHAFFNLGGAYAEVGQYVQALSAYTTVETLGQGEAFSALLYRPQVFLAVGNYDAAIKDLNNYILGTNEEYFHTVALMLRAEAYLYKQMFDLSFADYNVVVSNNATKSFVLDYQNQGVGFRVTSLRQTSDLPQLAATVNTKPTNPTGLYALGTLQMELGLWAQANTSYKAYFALQKAPMPSSLSKLLKMLNP